MRLQKAQSLRGMIKGIKLCLFQVWCQGTIEKYSISMPIMRLIQTISPKTCLRQNRITSKLIRINNVPYTNSIPIYPLLAINTPFRSPIPHIGTSKPAREATQTAAVSRKTQTIHSPPPTSTTHSLRSTT